MKIYNLVIRNFAKNVIAIPPKLKTKNPVKENKNKLSPIYNLLKSEKLAESKSEKFNIEEKMDYQNIITDGSKTMLMNYYKIYQDKSQKLKDIKSLNEILTKLFTPKDLNTFIHELKIVKQMIETEDIEKTEEIFQLFLSKLYNLSENKALNKTLISLISKISLKEISPSDIFNLSKNQHKGETDETSSASNLQKAIYFSQLESNYSSVLNIRNPITSDYERPETDFKDAFTMKQENSFRYPLLIQKNPDLTQFDFSNFVFFHHMPFFYPVKDTELNKTVIKHLNNEIIYKNRINLNSTPEFKNFVQKYLKRALNVADEQVNTKIEILNMYSVKNPHYDYYDFELINESLDFIQEVFDNTEESRNESMNRVSRFRTFSNSDRKGKESEIFDMNRLIENTKYLQLKKHEIEKNLKNKLKSPIFCNGIIQFNNYEEKKNFLRSGAGILGVHLQGMIVRSYDADFCNLLQLYQFISEEIKIEDLLKFINSNLKIQNFQYPMLEIPNYENSAQSHNLIKSSDKVFLRFNSFMNAYKAYQILSSRVLKNDIQVKLIKPVIRFYNGYFSSGAELVIKNTITNIDKVLSIQSNYCEGHNILEKEII